MSSKKEDKIGTAILLAYRFMFIAGPIFYIMTSLHFQWKAIKEIRLNVDRISKNQCWQRLKP